MFFPGRRFGLALALLLLLWSALFVPAVRGQDTDRKTKSRIEPAYPELAVRMKISGIVRVDVTVAANGAVKQVKVVGGHPLLTNAVVDAVKRWRFEPGPEETTEKLQFRFDGNQ
jgi:TonB family protein